MKLMLVGSWEKTEIHEIGERFASGQYSNPPEPCDLIARWHDPSSKRFWLVVEVPDSKIIQAWMSRWTDIVEWETFVVLDDQEVGELIGQLL